MCKNRTETCAAEGSSCLLAIEGKVMEELRDWMLNSGYRADYSLLCSALKKSFNKKQVWRKVRTENYQ